jgi:DNA-binding beta-propeller fold protein YncE
VIPSSGVIVVADTDNNRIRLVTPLGVVTTLAGNGTAAFANGTGTAASFNDPSGVAVIPSSGMIVVADAGNNRIRLVTPAGVVTTLAGSGSAAFADGTGAAASFNYPSGVAVIPSSGLIVVADAGNNRIRLVDPTTGVVTTLAGNGMQQAFADGIGTAASFYWPRGVAVIPSSGVIVVADYNNNCIRLVTPLGVVTTLAGNAPDGGYADGTGAAASFSQPNGVAVIPSSGVIVVCDRFNNRIRLVTPLGVVTTLAGGCGFYDEGVCLGGYADGTGENALFYKPAGVAVTPSGAIVVADTENRRIRLIT